jgi:hypothetical protein
MPVLTLSRLQNILFECVLIDSPKTLTQIELDLDKMGLYPNYYVLGHALQDMHRDQVIGHRDNGLHKLYWLNPNQ